MIVLNCGIARSGTVWTFNVLRQICEHGRMPCRTLFAAGDVELERCLDSLSPAEHVIIHGVEVSPALAQMAAQRDVRPFFNYRDPRDVVVSQIRLHEISCERAIEQTASSFRQFTLALGLPGITVIPYAHILEHPQALIFQMATRLGVLLKLGEIETITRETSADRHRLIAESPVQSRRCGRWRDELDPVEQQMVNERFAPLVKVLGFDAA